MARWLPIATAFILILAAGVANGLWVDRWVVSHDLERMTERIGNVPLVIGDWEGVDQDSESHKELTARLIREGILHALVSREYKNKQTGESIALLLATGRPGPISTHNPLTCYGASGFSQSSSVANINIHQKDKGPFLGQFSKCSFHRLGKNGIQESLTAYWAWQSPEGWIATSNPRVSFASYRALTKIYVIRSDLGYLAGINLKPELDPVVHFVQDCLPTIDATLFEKNAAASKTETAAASANTNAGA